MEYRRFSPQDLEIVVPAPRQKSSISVVGLGYVGAVSTACLASLGHRVIGVDLDQAKVNQIGLGQSPIHEDRLTEILTAGVEDGLISATDDLRQAVIDTDVTFVSVGTPTAADGGCDHNFIKLACDAMARGLRDKEGFHVFAMRCSIPPGTTMKVMAPILEAVSGKAVGRDFGICFNPEFLREGVAIDDFHNPPKTVIGTTDFATAEIMRRIYAPVDDKPILTTIEVAETIKYVDNVWHATKVCFANEVGRLCKPLGVDSHAVMEIFTQDQKLNLSAYYLKPGFAYGGSCLPKEVRAVQHVANTLGVDLPMIGALEQSNAEQIQQAVEMAQKTGAKRVGILGLAFKPGTDDLRESPILEAMATLQQQGVELLVHDEAVTKDTPLDGLASYTKYGSQGLTKLAEGLSDMLRDDVESVMVAADVVIVCHASDTYRDAVQRHKNVAVVDVVRLFDSAPQDLEINGIGW